MKPGIMLDIETTGFNPCHHFMTSFAFVEFDENFQITNVMSRRIPNRSQPYDRGSDIDTLSFRKRELIDEMELEIPVAESAFRALREIQEYFYGASLRLGEYDLWARHTEFDVAFMHAYFREKGLDIPWGHRVPSDLPTLLKYFDNIYAKFNSDAIHEEAKRSSEFMRDVQKWCHENAGKHNAIYDAILDVHILRAMYTKVRYNATVG